MATSEEPREVSVGPRITCLLRVDAVLAVYVQSRLCATSQLIRGGSTIGPQPDLPICALRTPTAECMTWQNAVQDTSAKLYHSKLAVAHNEGELALFLLAREAKSSADDTALRREER